MVVEESRCQTDALVSGHVGQRVVVVRGVDGVHMDRSDHPLLHGFEGVGRPAAHHQGPSLQILHPDELLFSQRIGKLRNQIDPAGVEPVEFQLRIAAHMVVQRKQNVLLTPEEGIRYTVVLEVGHHLRGGIGGGKAGDGLRQQTELRPDAHTDGDALGVLGAEILSLLHGPLQVRTNVLQGFTELGPGWGQLDGLALPVENAEAHLILQRFDLVGQGGLGDKQVLRRPAEIQSAGQLQNIVHLLGQHKTASFK